MPVSKTSQTDYAKTKKYLLANVFSVIKKVNSDNNFDTTDSLKVADFEKILQKCKDLGIGINGIETWLNGEFFDCQVVEDNGNNPFDANWYFKVFEHYKGESVDLDFLAIYVLPESIIKTTIKSD